MLDPTRNSGSLKRPLFCRFKNAGLSLVGEYKAFTRTFPVAWTEFPLRPEKTFAKMPNGARYGPGIVLDFNVPDIKGVGSVHSCQRQEWERGEHDQNPLKPAEPMINP
jgi:hypothetical protein